MRPKTKTGRMAEPMTIETFADYSALCISSTLLRVATAPVTIDML